MSEQPAQVSKRRFPFGWLFTWRTVRRGVFVIACLVTLLAVFIAEENWRGKRAFNKFKNEWEAKGEKFDLKSFIPPPVPDEQNFTMTPFLAPLFDFNPLPLQPGQTYQRDTNGMTRLGSFAAGLFSARLDDKGAGRRWPKERKADFEIWFQALATNDGGTNTFFASRTEAATELLKDFEKYRPVLEELQTASQRPYSRFNIAYDRDDPFGVLLPHLAVMKRISQMFALRARGELVLGQHAAASADTRMVVYLAGTMKNEPLLISGLVRLAILRIADEVIEEGLAAHQWTGDELAELETDLGKPDLLAEYGLAMRGERAIANAGMDFYRNNRKRLNELGGIGFEDGGGNESSAPKAALSLGLVVSGFFYQNELNIDRMHQELLLPPVDAAGHRVFPTLASKNQTEMEREFMTGFRPYKMFAHMLLPSLIGSARKYAIAQTELDEAAVACALERYRLANGKYPTALDALKPQLIKAIPMDVISGEALKYHATDDGRYILYSIGWNEQDDGGAYGMNRKGTAQDFNTGDWPWPPRR